MNEELQNEYVDVDIHDNYPSSDEHVTVPPMKVLPLKKICMTIGQLPTAYLETMTYYEMLLWFIGYLRDNIIPTVNNNGEALEEVQTIVMSLQNYINNFKDSIDQDVEDLEAYMNDYFENLDVQEEIDNKLDDMVEAGTLQEIIADYLNSKAIFGYDSVADMKLATNLIDGSFAKTLGYYSVNDGGSALYKIREKLISEVTDEKKLIAVYDNTLVAELVNINKEVNIDSLGAKGDGTTDDTSIFAYAIANFNKINCSSGKTYIIEELTIDDYININGNNCIFKPLNEVDYIIRLQCQNNEYNGLIENIIFEGDHKATDLILNDSSWRRVLQNITLNNPITNGFHGIGAGGGTRLVSINGKQSDQTISSTFLKIEAPDFNINMADYQGYKTGLYSNSNLQVNQFHGYILGSEVSIYEGSKFMHLAGGRLTASNVYPDTQQFWFYVETVGSYHIASGTGFHNDDVTDTIIESTSLQHGYVIYNASNNNHGVTRRFYLSNFSIQTPDTITKIKFINFDNDMINICGVDVSPSSSIDLISYTKNPGTKLATCSTTSNSTYFNNQLKAYIGENCFYIAGYLIFNETATLSDTNSLEILQLNERYTFLNKTENACYGAMIGADFGQSSGNTEVKFVVNDNKLSLNKLKATSLASKRVYLMGMIPFKVLN